MDVLTSLFKRVFCVYVLVEAYFLLYYEPDRPNETSADVQDWLRRAAATERLLLELTGLPLSELRRFAKGSNEGRT